MSAPQKVWELPEPPPLHTEECFHAIGRPAFEQGGSEAHWYDWWIMLCVALRSFGAPAALYDRCVAPVKTRRAAYEVLRMLESALRRILLIMAREDTRPLMPCPPRGPARERAPHKEAARPVRAWPGRLSFHFPLIPLERAARAADAPAPKPRKAAPIPVPEVLNLPPLDRQDAMGQKVMIAEFRRDHRENRPVSILALAARLEALIRIYKNPRLYVMRLRQRLAAEQGRSALTICHRMLRAPARLQRYSPLLEGLFDEAFAAANVLPETRPPIAGA